MNPVRPTSLTGAKSKKPLKSKVNKAQQPGPSRINQNCSSNQNENSPTDKDKISPVKEFQDFAGIGADSVRIYSEQESYDQLTEDATNMLTEDINYKLRHILHECIVKSKLQGRESIISEDVDETFSDLNIDKVYGAPSSPNWVPFADKQEITLHYLDDQQINLVEIAEQDINLCQEGEPFLERSWLPKENDSEDDMEEYKETLTEYFETMCESVISDNEEVRHMALKDISTNASIGTITNWFYHFGYLLLTKDVTYDCLTMRALQLLEVLENSPLPSIHIYPKQLKLLVRLLMQRLRSYSVSKDTLKYMCYVLSLFCLRPTLRKFAISKLEDKMLTMTQDIAVPLLNIIYFLGIDAVKKLFLPYYHVFLATLEQEDDPDLREIILAIYGLLCKANLNTGMLYQTYRNVFGECLVPYFRPKNMLKPAPHQSKVIDTVEMKKNLIKTRRKVDPRSRTKSEPFNIQEVFDVSRPPENPNNDLEKTVTELPEGIMSFNVSHLPESSNNDLVKTRTKVPGGVSFKIRKISIVKGDDDVEMEDRCKPKRETQITVGKTSLLLSILQVKTREKCFDHSLISCWL